MSPPSLPHFPPFPSASVRSSLPPAEWEASLEAWVALGNLHLARSDSEFARLSAKDESLAAFLVSFLEELGRSMRTSDGTVLDNSSPVSKALARTVYRLVTRLLPLPGCPPVLHHWGFLADLAAAYSLSRTVPIIAVVLPSSGSAPVGRIAEASLTTLKKFLTRDLDGVTGSSDEDVLRELEARLRRLAPLIAASPFVAAFFMTGTDFVDALGAAFRVVGEGRRSLREAVVGALYLCLVGLTKGEDPKWGLLTDQLYSLRGAVEARRKVVAATGSGSDDVVVELVTVTPLLRKVKESLEAAGKDNARTDAVLESLSAMKRPEVRRRRGARRKVDKGKGVAGPDVEEERQMHVHKLSQITQVQDLFPELGSGFVARLLDEYDDDTEKVIAHLLEGNLPPHLASADKSEQLWASSKTLYDGCHANVTPSPAPPHSSLSPRSTPPVTTDLPVRPRRNIHDNDEFDNLAVPSSQLHFGKRDPDATADDLLASAPEPGTEAAARRKAAILSALAAFDSDDDEKDDTYDGDDVGGAIVDGSTITEGVIAGPGQAGGGDGGGEDDANDEVLYRAWTTTPAVFDRDAATRRSADRRRLRDETGLTDEAIEGWAVMLARSPARRRRLETRFSGAGLGFSGHQDVVASTAWRGGRDDEDGEESGPASGAEGGRGGAPRGGRPGGRGGARGGRGRGRGDAAGPSGHPDTEAARRRKEQHKGSRANHNRRDQRARKMARGGFPG